MQRGYKLKKGNHQFAGANKNKGPRAGLGFPGNIGFIQNPYGIRDVLREIAEFPGN